MTTTKILFKIHVYENDNKKNPSASKDKLVLKIFVKSTALLPPYPTLEKGKVVKLRQPNKIVLDRKETCK